MQQWASRHCKAFFRPGFLLLAAALLLALLRAVLTPASRYSGYAHAHVTKPARATRTLYSHTLLALQPGPPLLGQLPFPSDLEAPVLHNDCCVGGASRSRLCAHEPLTAPVRRLVAPVRWTRASTVAGLERRHYDLHNLYKRKTVPAKAHKRHHVYTQLGHHEGSVLQ